MFRHAGQFSSKIEWFAAAIILCCSGFGSVRAEDVGASNAEAVKLFPIVQEGKWGYIDAEGKVVIKPQYDAAFDFYEGLACVLQHPWRGYIDQTGKMIIKPKFPFAGRFNEGLAPVTDTERLYGGHVNYYNSPAGIKFIDRTGKIQKVPGSTLGMSEGIVVCPRLRTVDVVTRDGEKLKHDARYVTRFSEGFAAAFKDRLWGYLDHEMKWVVPPTYHDAGGFSEGLAAVELSDPAPPKPTSGRIYDKWRKNRKVNWGYIDKTGKVVIELKYKDSGRFSEGMAPVRVGEKWGFIDATGTEVVKPQFDYAWPFSEGLARVLVAEKQGFIDKAGTLIVEPQYQPAWEFSKGLARVILEGKEGYINKQGSYVWEPTK